MILEWKQHGERSDCFVSTCGKYSVAYDVMIGTWRVYRLAPGGPRFAQIAQGLANEEAAKAIAEQDLSP